MSIIHQLQNTRYGVAVGLFKGKEVYLSRRSEQIIFGKKWQFINGRMRGAEVSAEGAIRLVEEQTGITITKDRLYDIRGNINVEETGEFYYVYLVHLKENECPTNPDEKIRGPWRLFPMEASIVLDLVPGVRDILRKLHKCLSKVESEKQLTPDEMAEANTIYDEQRTKELSEVGELYKRNQQRKKQNEEFASTDYGC